MVSVSQEPQSTSTAKFPEEPPGKLPDTVPAKKAINQSVNMNTYSPSLAYDKDINPYAKSATASALDAVGEAIVQVILAKFVPYSNRHIQ